MVGYKLAKPSVFEGMFRQGWGQFIPFIVTVIGILFTDLLIGIGLELHVAVVVILFENYRLPFQIRNFQHEEGERVRITLAQQVTFLNKASVLKSLDAIPPDSFVEIDASKSIYIHPDIVEIIANYVVGAPAKGIKLKVIGLDDEHQVDRRSGMRVAIKPPPVGKLQVAK